jgi:subtilisin family serine protease
MRKRTLLLVVLFFTSLGNGGSIPLYAQDVLSIDAPKLMDVVPGVLYLQFRAKHGIDFEHLSPTHTGNAELDHLFSTVGVSEIYPFDTCVKNFEAYRRHGIDRMYVIHYSGEGNSPRTLGLDFLKLNVVEFASPRYIFQLCYTPNDPQITEQYALDNMHIKDAWGISKGSSDIVIADLDVGVNYTHEDIAANIFHVEGDHIGKDIVGDAGTWNKFRPDFDPMPHVIPGLTPLPPYNHGSLTTGCFGAIADNGIGGAGSGFNCKVMIVKISNDSTYIYGGYEGITYAATHGAKILNCSWGGAADPGYIAMVQNIVDATVESGVLIVTASGNQGRDIDKYTYIPACLKNVLTVGATDINDQPASFTNFGKLTHVFAPGTGIYSTGFPGNSLYVYDQGTSFSCPLTAGVAGLVWAKHPDWSPKFVTRQIIQTCDNVVNPSNRAKYWGRVNAYAALSNTTVPGLKISGFSVDGVSNGGLKYIDKVYSLDVKFKNYMAAGSGIQAKLISYPGTADPSISGYTIQQSTATLGSMNSLQEVSGSYKFTRDTNDDGQGSQILLAFAISYGTATVEGSKYFDTLILPINITGDGEIPVKGVEDKTELNTQLGNSFPNPVSVEGAIAFDLANSDITKLSICDILGRTITVLSEGFLDKGHHQASFNANTLENGVYFYKLETSGAVITKRLIVVH